MLPFPEEQLDSPVGYFAAQPGQVLNKDRWTIIRKLGWGPRSSTWLVVDKDDSNYYNAVKIFTVAATEDSSGENESFLLRLRPLKKMSGFPTLVEYFYEVGPKGKHLCLVLHVLGSSVEKLRLTNTGGGFLPLHTVQKVASDILANLAELADLDIIHGAAIADNFLFCTVQRGEEIRMYTADSPCGTVEEVMGGDGIAYPVLRSQPIRHNSKWDSTRLEIAHEDIILSNFSHARRISKIHPWECTPEPLTGKNVSTKSDVWMVGCTVYLLLTGTQLFSESDTTVPVEIIEQTVAQLEGLLLRSGRLKPSDIPATASFLRSCLAIEPSERLSADDLCGDVWVKEGNMCSCGWCANDPLLPAD